MALPGGFEPPAFRLGEKRTASYYVVSDDLSYPVIIDNTKKTKGQVTAEVFQVLHDPC